MRVAGEADAALLRERQRRQAAEKALRDQKTEVEKANARLRQRRVHIRQLRDALELARSALHLGGDRTAADAAGAVAGGAEAATDRVSQLRADLAALQAKAKETKAKADAEANNPAGVQGAGGTGGGPGGFSGKSSDVTSSASALMLMGQGPESPMARKQQETKDAIEKAAVEQALRDEKMINALAMIGLYHP
jgi:DNA repair exonuclease SbcCD ATPase subunit